MMSKWDTIQLDVADMYAHLDELEQEQEEDMFDSDIEDEQLEWEDEEEIFL